MTLPERAASAPVDNRADSSSPRSSPDNGEPAGAARCGNDRAQQSALDSIRRHVKRREAIRRVLDDIDNELTEAVARAREAGVSDSAIAATAVIARASNRREDV